MITVPQGQWGGQNWCLPSALVAAAAAGPVAPRRPCRLCGRPMDPVLYAPRPAGCGRDAHPCCDVGAVWWTAADFAAVEAMLRAAGLAVGGGSS